MGTSTPELELAVRAELSLSRKTVAVLHGGTSGEREISLASGREVSKALTGRSWSGDERGPARVLGVEIEAGGAWSIDGRSYAPLEALTRLVDQVDLVFFALHGGDGEDGTLQGLFETLGLAYTGSGVPSSARCMDKEVARVLARAYGASVAPGLVQNSTDWKPGDGALRSRVRELGSAWIVKPLFGGSSVGASLVRSIDELDQALETSFAWEPRALIEGFVDGIELTGGIVSTPEGRDQALPVVEIRPHEGRFFDYEEKYDSAGAQELCPPESVSPEVCMRIQELSLGLHAQFGCRGYSRSDFILPHGSSEPVFLETNTLPGLTRRSLLPLAAAEGGIDYRTLCLWILESAARAKAERP